MCIVSSIDSAKHIIRSSYRTLFTGFENTKAGFQFRVWVYVLGLTDVQVTGFSDMHNPGCKH